MNQIQNGTGQLYPGLSGVHMFVFLLPVLLFFCFGSSVSVKSLELLPFTVALLHLNETKCQIFPPEHTLAHHIMYTALHRAGSARLYIRSLVSLIVCLCVCWVAVGSQL